MVPSRLEITRARMGIIKWHAPALSTTHYTVNSAALPLRVLALVLYLTGLQHFSSPGKLRLLGGRISPLLRPLRYVLRELWCVSWWVMQAELKKSCNHQPSWRSCNHITANKKKQKQKKNILKSKYRWNC